MYVNVVYVMSSLYSAVGLTLVREQHFVRIETPEGGAGGGGGGKLYLTQHCHRQNGSCIQMGKTVSRLIFNCEGQSHKTVSTDHNI